MSREPAAGIGTAISALLALTWTILKANNIAITDDVKDQVEAVIWALIAMPAVSGFLIRGFVTPADKAREAVEHVKTQAQAAVDQAYLASPGVDPKPTIGQAHHAV